MEWNKIHNNRIQNSYIGKFETWLEENLSFSKIPENIVTSSFSPTVSILDKEYIVVLMAPCITQEQTRIKIIGDKLEIQYIIEDKNFNHIVQLGYDIDPDLIFTTFKNGVLRICIPRVNKE